MRNPAALPLGRPHHREGSAESHPFPQMGKQSPEHQRRRFGAAKPPFHSGRRARVPGVERPRPGLQNPLHPRTQGAVGNRTGSHCPEHGGGPKRRLLQRPLPGRNRRLQGHRTHAPLFPSPAGGLRRGPSPLRLEGPRKHRNPNRLLKKPRPRRAALSGAFIYNS